MVVGDESIAACAHNNNKDDNKKMKTTDDDCVGIWGNKKKGRGETNISKVSQPPAGPRIKAAQARARFATAEGRRKKLVYINYKL